MRHLILTRHAKSSWADSGQRDIDRPLNPRGVRDAPRVGAWLRDQGWLPDHALVSGAVRTRQTFAEMGFSDLPHEVTDTLYHADPGTMLAVLRGAPRDARRVLMLGHQPGIGAFAAGLLDARVTDDDFARYPTCATTVMEFDIDDWRRAEWGAARLLAFIIPRRLPDQ